MKVWRNELCNNAITKAEQVYNEWGISITKRKHMMPGKYADDSALNIQQEMQHSLIEILDKLTQNVKPSSNIKELERCLGSSVSLVNYMYI